MKIERSIERNKRLNKTTTLTAIGVAVKVVKDSKNLLSLDIDSKKITSGKLLTV